MPAQEKLISKIQENPPDNFAELETLMQECGYGITITDPGMAEDSESDEDKGPDDEMSADSEEDSDMEMEEVSEDEIPADIKEIMKAMTGMGMSGGKHDLSPGGRNKERLRVARIVMKKR